MTRAAAPLRLATLVLPVLLVLGLASAKAPPGPALVSTTDGGVVANDASDDGAVAPNGKYVVFGSRASDLGGGVSSDRPTVWFRDVKKGVTELVSRTPAGAQPDDESYFGSLSNNGRYILYESYATDIVPGAVDGYCNVYLLDRKTGETVRISSTPAGAGGDWHSYVYGTSISGNGRYGVFYSGALDMVPDAGIGYYQVYFFDRSKGELRMISRSDAGAPALGDSFDPSISANGRYVVYYSYATNLGSGATGGVSNIYLYDVKKGTTTRVTRATGGGEPNDDSYDPVVANNGKVIAFQSYASNLVPGDGNGASDVFLQDLKKGTVTRSSVGAGGLQADGDSYSPSLSSSGKVLVFFSGAENLVAGDMNGATDLFVVDTKGKKPNRRLSTTAAGGEAGGDSWSYAPSLSSNGKWLLFTSDAADVVPGDGNGVSDLFLVKTK